MHSNQTLVKIYNTGGWVAGWIYITFTATTVKKLTSLLFSSHFFSENHWEIESGAIGVIEIEC